MKPDQWQEVDRLYYAALECPLEERTAFLEATCAGRDSLRHDVQVLLAAHDQANSFIERPAMEVEARSVADDQNDLVVGQTVAHYKIISQLGAGGMGEVYLAQDTVLGRKVALKLLPACFTKDPDRLRRFEQEARAASALNHPNIVTTYEIGHDGPFHFIAEEFIDGVTLRELMSGRRLELNEALDIATQIASALAAAHEKGIVHRDIKPENIMVDPGGHILGRQNHVKILDFGIAKLTEPSGAVVNPEATTRLLLRTEEGSALGTVPYMSPEQTRGESVDARTDIWSLGVVLYEMLTGQQPFGGVTAQDVSASILRDDVPPLPSKFPESLKWIVKKSLRKDQEDRYQTARELFSDLRDQQAEVRSVPPTGLIRTTSGRPAIKTSAEYVVNQVKRHWRAAVVALAVLALALTATLFWYFKRAPAAPILTDKDTILLADFENETGEEVFDAALKQGLAIQLGQSPFLSIFPDSEVRKTLKLMNRSPDEHVTGEIAREICERQGLKAFIAGSIAPLGNQYVLTLEAVNGHSGDVLAREQTEPEGKEQVLKALSQAATRLRERLGESLSSIEKFANPLEVTTSSLEALKAFSLGNELRDKGAHLEAIPFFKRATELDPNFASAYMLLAITYDNTGQFGMKAELAAKAYALRERVTERERLRITDRYYAYVTHELDRHVETLQIYKRTYPRDPLGPFWLSDVYFNLGQFERAVEEATEGIRRSPSFGLAYVNLSQALIPLNRFDEAREVSEGLLQRQVDHSDIHSYLYQIAFVYGDSGGMRKQLDWARGRSEQYVALDWQADTAAFTGQWQRAQDFSRGAVTVATQSDVRDPAGGFAAKVAAYGAVFGQCAQAKESAAQAFALSQSDRPSVNALIGLALCGESTRAARSAEDYNKRYPKDTFFNGPWLPAVRGAVELQRGNAARAIELLEAARRYEGAAQFWPQYLRGQAYLKLNRGEEAATEFQKILDHRGEGPLSALYPLAHLGLARAASLMHETEKSRKEYENFFALWKDADAELPILEQAKRGYEKLRP